MKVLVADDHELFREGLRLSLTGLADEIEIFEAENFQKAIELIQKNTDLSLALLDLNMPDMIGIQAINKIMDEFPTVPVVVLSASNDTNDMRQVLDSGAMGYIPKSETSAVILSALQLVLSGGTYVPPALINSHKRTKNTGTNNTGLTPRQIEVLKLLANGESNKEIARNLGLSGATVKAHLSAVFKALKVCNRTQAASAAKKLGLI